FFSSRRRHTRFSRDWSSDVCSSDLPVTALAYAVLQGVGSALHSGALEAWYVDELHRLEPEAPLQSHLALVDVAQASGMLIGSAEIGRASCRERVWIARVAVAVEERE